MKERRNVFIAGGTSYMGQRLIPRLLQRGHDVRALVRPGSEGKLPHGCRAEIGNALDASSYAGSISPADTFGQLVGVAHPSPAKSAEFRRIDLPAGLGAISAAKTAGIRHFVYLSVAHPAPMMKAYIAVRTSASLPWSRQASMRPFFGRGMCWGRDIAGGTSCFRSTKLLNGFRKLELEHNGWGW